jgi:hypothetical protein
MNQPLVFSMHLLQICEPALRLHRRLRHRLGLERLWAATCVRCAVTIVPHFCRSHHVAQAFVQHRDLDAKAVDAQLSRPQQQPDRITFPCYALNVLSKVTSLGNLAHANTKINATVAHKDWCPTRVSLRLKHDAYHANFKTFV